MQDGQLLVMKRNKYGQEYYTLVGGGIKAGETPEQALVREVAEEASMRITALRHIFTEDAGAPFGPQYIFLCEHVIGTPRLAPHSEELAINKLGQNLHEPMWMPLDKLATVPFRSEALKYALLEAFEKGFPDQPVLIDPSHYHHAIHKRS